MNFLFSKLPTLYFGPGRIKGLVEIIKEYGNNILFIKGKNSLENSGNLSRILALLKENSIQFSIEEIQGEPTPDFVDHISEKYRSNHPGAVLSIGGGSVLDAGKAVSAMIPERNFVMDYLEGVGKGISHSGTKLPFIAVPTTSGTGSEVTKNAVLSRTGIHGSKKSGFKKSRFKKSGFKKSLRHDNFVSDKVIIDPELIITCPPDITASSGLDAFSQLLEAFVSIKSSPLSDALAIEGIKNIKNSLYKAVKEPGNLEARSGMAYAAYLSGICLANAGLGTVHGLAGALGGIYNIPHGTACGTLLAACMEKTIRNLQSSGGTGCLEKFASVGRIISGRKDVDVNDACELLIKELNRFTETLKIKKLDPFGVKEEDLSKIVSVSGNKNNPVKLSEDELSEILRSRL